MTESVQELWRSIPLIFRLVQIFIVLENTAIGLSQVAALSLPRKA